MNIDLNDPWDLAILVSTFGISYYKMETISLKKFWD